VITDKAIKALPVGAWKSEKAHKGAGRFAIRKTTAGTVLFYYRYVGADGRRKSHPVGHYDPKGKNGLTLIQARDKAADMSRQVRSGEITLQPTPLSKQIKEAFEVTGATEFNHATPHERNPDNSNKHQSSGAGDSFEDVLDTYVKYLVARGAESAEAVRKNFERYLKKPFPNLCARQAKTLTTKDLLPPLEVLIDAEKGPSALRLRTQIYSAFERAIKSENDPRIKDRTTTFGLCGNPVRDIPALSEFKNAGDRALSEKELAHYAYALTMLEDSASKDALQTSLFLGGQRMKQLLRANSSNVDFEGQNVTVDDGRTIHMATITLKDGKGRRLRPRNHVLPIVGNAISILQRLAELNNGKPSIFADKNGKPISPASTSTLVAAISKKLLADGHIRSPFCYADIRRTCETLFANYNVPKDIRAQIQSHGLSGVQETHYDRYDYLLQKYDALTLWNKKLDELIGKFVTKTGPAKSHPADH